jgi:hypothetical protein
MQLSQVVAQRIYANLKGLSLDDVSAHVGDITYATWFALAGVLSLAIGMRCGQGRIAALQDLPTEAKTWSPSAAFIFCLLTVVIAFLFGVAGNLATGLAQPALAASQIQWLGIFALTCVCVAQRRGYPYLLLVVGVEVVQGFTGFFGDFKQVFIVVLIGVFSVRRKLSPGNIVIGLLVATVMLMMGVFWSAIKKDYRAFVNLGSGQQVALVPLEERIQFLVNRTMEADWQTMSEGFELLMRRWGYIDLLAATMNNVPAIVPFQDGAQIGAAVMHTLQPRLLFPDKPLLDSENKTTVRYSGIRFDRGGNDADTTISLGYLAELYVDFGQVGALATMFVFGFVFGHTFKLVTSSESLPAIVNAGLGVMLMMSVMSFEQSLVKMVGGFLTTLLAVLVIRKFVLPSLMGVFGWPSRAPISVAPAE